MASEGADPARGRVGVLLALFAAALALPLLLALGLAAYASHSHDAEARRTTQAQADRALRVALRRLGQTAVDYAYWDEAVQNLVVAHDPQWFERNLGAYLRDTFKLSGAAVLDDAGRVTASAFAEAEEGPAPADARGIGELLARAQAFTGEKPVAATSLIMLGGRPHLAAASALTPFDSSAWPVAPPRGWTLLLLAELDQARIAELAEDLQLPELAFEPAEAPAREAGRGGLALSAPDGTPLGALAWRQARPGADFLRMVVLPAALTLLAMGVLASLAARRILAIARARRRALDAAQAAVETKTLFLANMSHELRTPLNAVIGFSEVMEQELFGPLGHPAYKQYARDVHWSGKHLLGLIDDVLEFSRIEAGEMRRSATRIDLAVTARQALTLLEAKARAKGIDVAIEAQTGLPAALADQRGMRQVFINLLDNAIKWTPQGGRVRLSLQASPRGGLKIVVSDTGPGIAPELQEEVWRPFSQAPDAQITGKGGSGLGLAIVRTLVRLHDGEVSLRSAPGAGAAFTILLPPERSVAEPEPRAA